MVPRPRPVAARMSRSFDTVVWKITVDSSPFSAMCVPSRIIESPAAPSPGSTSWMDDTAKTLDGTTRAVTEAGMSLAWSGLRLMCT